MQAHKVSALRPHFTVPVRSLSTNSAQWPTIPNTSNPPPLVSFSLIFPLHVKFPFPLAPNSYNWPYPVSLSKLICNWPSTTIYWHLPYTRFLGILREIKYTRHLPPRPWGVLGCDGQPPFYCTTRGCETPCKGPNSKYFGFSVPSCLSELQHSSAAKTGGTGVTRAQMSGLCGNKTSFSNTAWSTVYRPGIFYYRIFSN